MTTAVRSELERWFEETQASGLRSGGGLPFWYHGLCSRREAERLLQGKPMGSYLLRLSQSQGGLVLSYSGIDRCRHFIVQEVGGQYVILGEDRRHRSVTQLLDYHRLVPIPPWTEYLTSPCLKRTERCYEEIAGTLGPERNSRDPVGGADDIPDWSGGETDSEPGESLGAAGGVGMNPTGGRQHVERCYEEIAGTLGLPERNSRDPGGGADHIPDRPAGETDMESGLPPRHSSPEQMPDGHYEEIREIQRQARRLGSPARVPGQSVGLGSDSLPAGGAASGNGGGYQEIPDRHYEEIREIRRRARGRGSPSGDLGQPVGPGSDSLPAGGEASRNDGGYQAMDEVHGSAVRESGRSSSPRRGAETRGPVPTPPAYATVNKAGAHVYTEPGEGGPRATPQQALPLPGHEYSELEPQRARLANHYCPDPTAGQSRSLAPGARTLPGNNRSLCPTSPALDHAARPLPDPTNRPLLDPNRPTAPISDPTARPLPNPDGSLRPSTPTLDLTARPLPDPINRPLLDPNRPTALPPGTKARTLPNPNRSLRPTAPISDPTGQPPLDPNRRLWPSTLTLDPTARPLPDPDRNLRPTAPTHDSAARPLTPSSARPLPIPKTLSHDPTARPLPNRSPMCSPPTSDTTVRPLPNPDRSLRPTAPTSDPLARPLPNPDRSLRPSTPTPDLTVRPLPDSNRSLRPTAPTSDPTTQPLPDHDRSLRPTTPTLDPTVRPLPDSNQSLRPATLTYEPMDRPTPHHSLRPAAPAGKATPPIYAQPTRKQRGQNGPGSTAPAPCPIQLDDVAYGVVSRTIARSAASTPRPGAGRAENRSRAPATRARPGPGPGEVPPRPGPLDIPARLGPDPAELPPRPAPVENKPRLGPVENKPRPGPVENKPRPGPVENKPRLGPVEAPPRLSPGLVGTPPRPVLPAPRPTPVTPETGGGGGARPAPTQDGDLYETILAYQRPTAARPVYRRGRN